LEDKIKKYVESILMCRVRPKIIKLVFAVSSLKHTVLRSKSKDWLAWKQN
jgi:hypothetical protein